MGEDKDYRLKKRDRSDFEGGLLNQIDEFFYNEPYRNILDSIDGFFRQHSRDTYIPVDLYENDKEWVVKAELPGIKKEDIHVDIVGERLKITVTNRHDVKKHNESNDYYRRERQYHRSERVVQLPYAANKRTSRARYQNGILDIRGPKRPPSEHTLDIE
ncbi:Hsp20/alpha crystallin family protein [Tuberibacillus sp. Marseille-P3662]|uniref:Hsp20/alpha crystallin family protein n=1 Tax=Tuberibacillus sp. Marseille-P3662 TaxID=1965358 RepID=UPI000A1CEACA|nr:Hsp20/alpha crystallin family protein [Tuberibacillus sp. Marseille-P3662]